MILYVYSLYSNSHVESLEPLIGKPHPLFSCHSMDLEKRWTSLRRCCTASKLETKVVSFYGCFQGNDGRMLGLGKFVDVNHDGKYIWTCSFLLLASQQDFRRPTKTLGHPKLWWFFVCHFLPLQDIPYLYVNPNLPHRNVASDFVLPLPLGVVDWKTLQANVSKVQNERSGGRVDVWWTWFTGIVFSG